MFEFRVNERCLLRLLQERHAEIVFECIDRNRPHLRQWLPWLDMNRSVENTRLFIRRTLEQLAENAGFAAGIWSGEAFAGVIGFHRIDWANRKASIGYWLSAEFQGRGLMTDACRAFVQYGFDHYGLARIEIHCAVENKKSRAIPERLGFRCEGVMRNGEWLYDHYVDLAIYSMLAEEWPERPHEN